MRLKSREMVKKRQWQIGNGKKILRERRDQRSKKYDVGRFE